MSKVIVFTNLTLDGVMQAPGRPDEDRRGGFEHGGWGVPYAAMAQAGESIADMGALLLGRRTYEDFYAVWPQRKEDPCAGYFADLVANEWDCKDITRRCSAHLCPVCIAQAGHNGRSQTE